MVLFFCLFSLSVSGFGLIALPETWLRFSATATAGAWYAWKSSVSLFVIPIIILGLKYFKPRVATYAAMGWGIWIALLSLRLLSRVPVELPTATPYGVLLIAAILMFGLGAALVSLTNLSSK